MTGYVVHYRTATSVRTKSVYATSTSTFLTGLTSGPTYTISVEATSRHLSGESGVMTIALSELTILVPLLACVDIFFAPTEMCGYLYHYKQLF